MKVTNNGIHDDFNPVGVSDIGTFVTDNILFPENEPNYPELRLDSVTLSVNMAKNIVREKISTVRGEFKEYISTGDYDIIITALITPPLFAEGNLLPFGAQYPTDRLYDWHRIFKYNTEPLPVLSKYLNNILDVNKLIIERANISREAPDTFKLTMNCISDFDFDFGDFG